MDQHRTFTFVLFLAGVLAAGSVRAAEQTGTDTVTLTHAFGLQETGAPAPKMDAACKDKYGKYLGEKVVSEYKINPQTLIMSASSTFKSVPTQLFPMGISGGYYFMSDGIPKPLEELGVMRIIFSVDKAFKNPTSKLMFPLGVETYNCLLTNAAIVAADKDALAKDAKHK